MDIDAFRQAIAQGQAAQTPASPLGSFPELANLSRSQFQLGASEAPFTGFLGASQEAAQAAEAARSAERQRLANKYDPSKYQKVKKEDGGFDFFDPEGNRIDVKTYALRTNQSAFDALKDSENNLDIQYLNDYQNLQELLNALANEDFTKVDKFKAADEELKIFMEQTENRPADLVQRFKQFYPNVYKPNVSGEAGTGTVGRIAVPGPSETESFAPF